MKKINGKKYGDINWGAKNNDATKNRMDINRIRRIVFGMPRIIGRVLK